MNQQFNPERKTWRDEKTRKELACENNTRRVGDQLIRKLVVDPSSVKGVGPSLSLASPIVGAVKLTRR